MADVAEFSIGGITLATPSFQWSFVAGPASPEMVLVVDNVVDNELQNVDNPVTLRMSWEVSGSPQTLNVDKLYLGTRRRIDPWEVRWTLLDERSRFENLRVGGQFNITRAYDELTDTPNIGQGDLLDQFIQTEKFRYLPHTMKQLGDAQFSVPKAVRDEVPGTPWTALAIVDWILNTATQARPGTPSIDVRIEADDNRYVPHDVDLGPTGELFPDVLARFLNLARVGLYVDHLGTWVVYNLEEQGITARLGGFEGAGQVEVTDLSRVRPSVVTARFPSVFEIRLDYDEQEALGILLPPGGAFGDATRRMTRLDNVIQMPQTHTLASGRVVNRGEWIEVRDALEVFNELGFVRGLQLTSDDLRERILSVALEELAHTRGAIPDIDQDMLGRLRALRNGYRRFFRIPPDLLQTIKTWAPVRVALVDTVTGRQFPSPVWQDYAIIPSQKKTLTIGEESSATYAINVEHPQAGDDFNVEQAAPAFVRAVEPREFGIFQVAFVPDLHGNIAEFIPSKLTRPMSAATRILHREGLLHLNSYTEDFKLTTVISVRFISPNGHPGFYALSTTATDVGVDAKGPAYEFGYNREPARFRWKFAEATDDTGTTFIEDPVTQEPIIDNAELINRGTLELVARGEFERLYWSYQDRVTGAYSKATYDPDEDRPRGPVRVVSIRFSEGEVIVRHSMPEATPPPDLYVLLPEEVRRVIYREVDS